jgi:hypothetical protein
MSAIIRDAKTGKPMPDRERSLQVLQALADGVDPVSGEVFPSDSPYQQPEVIRALFYALNELKDIKGTNVTTPSGNQGKPWPVQEDELLTQRFKEGIKTTELARLHERSTGAIRSRLVKLGLVIP